MRNRLALYAIFLGVLTLSGCMNLTTRLQPDDVTVTESHQGEDCVPILLGIGIGTATVESATAKARNIAEVVRAQSSRNYVAVPADAIRKVRRLQFSDYQFLGFGARCIEVTGEGGSPVKAAAR